MTKDSLALSKTEFEIGLSSILERERECVNMQKKQASSAFEPFFVGAFFRVFLGKQKEEERREQTNPILSPPGCPFCHRLEADSNKD